MNLYAVRDRLIDYWLTPFAGPDDKAVMSGLAQVVNDQETNRDIAQAPQHFELWQIATITSDGHVEPKKGLVCQLDSLVRRSVRNEPGAKPAHGTLSKATQPGRPGTTEIDGDDTPE